jgi:uncharacterized protein (DUF302 family)
VLLGLYPASARKDIPREPRKIAYLQLRIAGYAEFDHGATTMTASTSYGFTKKINLPYRQAAKAVIDALKSEGFCVSRNDDLGAIRKTFALLDSLGIDRRRRVIWDLREPPFTHCTVSVGLGLELRMPHNIAIWGDATDSTVSVIDPHHTLLVQHNPALLPLAEDAFTRLERALRAL